MKKVSFWDKFRPVLFVITFLSQLISLFLGIVFIIGGVVSSDIYDAIFFTILGIIILADTIKELVKYGLGKFD